MQKQNQFKKCHFLVWHKDNQLYRAAYNEQTKQFIVEDHRGNLIIKLYGVEPKRFESIKKHLLPT